MSASEYDLVVIGSGPAGQKAAIAAAKARKRVAIIDRAVMIGGVSVHTGTIPSKTIREAIFQLAGLAVKALYGDGFRSRGISVQDVASRVSAIVERETEVVRAQLTRNGIAIYQGDALFLESRQRRSWLLAGRDLRTARRFLLTTVALWIPITSTPLVVFRKRSLLSELGLWALSTRRLWLYWVPTLR